MTVTVIAAIAIIILYEKRLMWTSSFSYSLPFWPCSRSIPGFGPSGNRWARSACI